MLRAAGHEDLGRVIAQSLFDGQLLGNGAFELLNAGGSGVFGKSGPDSGFCGRFDGLRGIPVRLARGEINDIDALRLHRFRRGGDAEGRGGDDASCAGRQLHGLCLRSRWQRRVAATATMTLSKSRRLRLMMSVWPWVMGSNVPGYTPIFMGSGPHP